MDYDQSPQPPLTYVSRVIPLVAGDAIDALELWMHDLASTNGVAPHWGLRRVAGSFTLGAAAPPSPGVFRRVGGDLVVGRPARRHAVEVELVPWSTRSTELGIRASGRRAYRLLGRGWAADRYFGAAHAFADELGDALTLLARLPDARLQPAAVARGALVRPHLRLVRYSDC